MVATESKAHRQPCTWFYGYGDLPVNTGMNFIIPNYKHKRTCVKVSVTLVPLGMGLVELLATKTDKGLKPGTRLDRRTTWAVPIIAPPRQDLAVRNRD